MVQVLLTVLIIGVHVTAVARHNKDKRTEQLKTSICQRFFPQRDRMPLPARSVINKGLGLYLVCIVSCLAVPIMILVGRPTRAPGRGVCSLYMRSNIKN